MMGGLRRAADIRADVIDHKSQGILTLQSGNYVSKSSGIKAAGGIPTKSTKMSRQPRTSLFQSTIAYHDSMLVFITISMMQSGMIIDVEKNFSYFRDGRS